MQIPVGLESESTGIVDVISRKALYFEGESGENIVEKSIPDNLVDITEEKRNELIGWHLLHVLGPINHFMPCLTKEDFVSDNALITYRF